MPSVVYFVRIGEFIKVGTSVSMSNRMSAPKANTPDEITLIGTCPGGVELERRLHDRLSSHHHRGEWFHATEAVLKVVRDMCGATSEPEARVAAADPYIVGLVGLERAMQYVEPSTPQWWTLPPPSPTS